MIQYHDKSKFLVDNVKKSATWIKQFVYLKQIWVDLGGKNASEFLDNIWKSSAIVYIPAKGFLANKILTLLK